MNDTNLNPSYYANITADVRYNKELTPNAKLLFAEITALTNKYGYCFASNNYFASLYEVTPQAISKWVKQLEKFDFINIEYIRDGKEIKERHIFISGTNHKVSINNSDVSTQSLEGINTEFRGYQQNVKDNITHNTILNIKPNNSSSELEALRKELEEAKATISQLKDSAKASSKKTKKKFTEEDVENYWSNYSSDTRECFTNIYRNMYRKAKELDPKFGRSPIQCQQNIIKIFEYAKNHDRDMHEVERIVNFGLNDSFWAGIITSPEGLTRNYEKLVSKSNTPFIKSYSYNRSAVGAEFDKKHKDTDYSKDDGGF